MDSIACRVMKNDIASLTRLLIHVVDAGKCHTDQLQIRAGLDYRPRKRAVAQQEDVSVPHILDQLAIGQASCVADEKVMTALFKQIFEPGPDRCFRLPNGFNNFYIHEFPCSTYKASRKRRLE